MRKVLYVAAEDVTATAIVDQMYEPLKRFLNDDFTIVIADFTEAYEIARAESPDLIVTLGEENEDPLVADLINLVKADPDLGDTPVLNASLEFDLPPPPAMECETRKVIPSTPNYQPADQLGTPLSRAGAPLDTRPMRKYYN